MADFDFFYPFVLMACVWAVNVIVFMISFLSYLLFQPTKNIPTKINSMPIRRIARVKGV